MLCGRNNAAVEPLRYARAVASHSLLPVLQHACACTAGLVSLHPRAVATNSQLLYYATVVAIFTSASLHLRSV